MRGRFITFEGGDGGGKSTQVVRLTERLQQTGLAVLATREPGGSARAETIRDLILGGAVASFGPAAEATMFTAARIDHCDTRIEPALAAGTWVISDRFSDSTRAYQGAAGAVPEAVIGGLEAVALGTLRPDLTFILDVPSEIGLGRARERRARGLPADRFEQQDGVFHTRLRQAFLAIAEADPKRCAVIDARAPIDAVAEAVWRIVEQRLLVRDVGDMP